jgi:hypothetical protein
VNFLVAVTVNGRSTKEGKKTTKEQRTFCQSGYACRRHGHVQSQSQHRDHRGPFHDHGLEGEMGVCRQGGGGGENTSFGLGSIIYAVLIEVSRVTSWGNLLGRATALVVLATAGSRTCLRLVGIALWGLGLGRLLGSSGGGGWTRGTL